MTTTTTTESTYVEQMEVFWGRYGKHIHSDSLKRVGKSGKLSSVRSMLSVGPGGGWIDDMVITNCFPPTATTGLRRYVGVDPDYDMYKGVEEKMNKCYPTVEKSFHHSTIQDWEPRVNADGTSEKFDLIMFYEMLYYFDESELAKVLYRCVDKLLAPGGRIMIALCRDAETSFYVKVVRKAWPEQVSFVPDSNIIERIIHDKYNGTVSFDRADEYTYNVDVREPYETAFLESLIHQTTDEEQRAADCLDRVRRAIRDVAAGKDEYVGNAMSVMLIKRN